MKLSRVIVVVVFLAILAMSTHPSIDSDTWWHLRAGQWMVDEGQMIREDVFSYTSAGKAWQYPGIWVQVMMFKLFDWFGPGGLNLWVSLTVTAIFGFVWRTMTGNDLFKAFILLLAAISSAIYWAARPYLISYLLFAIFLYILERNHHKEKSRLLWLLPILMIVWVNSHGGFLAGFILWGPYFLETIGKWIVAKRQERAEEIQVLQKAWKNLFWVGVVLLLSTLLNPQGFNLWSLPFTTVARQAEQLFIAEWQSPDFHNPTLMPFAWMLMLALALTGASKKRLSLHEILLLVGFGILGLVSVRNIFFFVIIAPAILARLGSEVVVDWGIVFGIQTKLDFSQSPTKAGAIINSILVVVVGLFALLRVVSYLPVSINQEAIEEQFPVAAVEFLQTEALPGRMFNTYNYGGYLIWSLPEVPVFVDGRADLHQDEIIMTWYRIINGADEWKDVFEEWDIQFVLVEPGVPLLSKLDEAGWKTIYEDDVAVIAVSFSPDIGKD